MRRLLGSIVALLLLTAGECDHRDEPEGPGSTGSEEPPDEALAAFRTSPAHALLCRIIEGSPGGTDVPRICTQIMCGAERMAEADFASGELASLRPSLGGLDLGSLPIGGNPSICDQCNVTGPGGVPPILHCNDLVTPGLEVPCPTTGEVCVEPGAGGTHGDPFTSPTTLSGFTFQATGPGAIYFTQSGEGGVRFPPAGMRVTLPALSCNVRVRAGGWAGPLTITPTEPAGTGVTSGTNHAEDLAIPGTMAELTIAGGGNEGVLFSVCATPR